MHVVFDLDGCLIDSAELIRQAYKEAGSVAPNNVLALEGVSWPGRDDARERKNAAYLRLLGETHIRWLPPFEVALRLHFNEHQVGILSGAPSGTIDVLRRRILQSYTWPFSHCLDGQSTEMKMWCLTLMTEGGVYVDDQTRLVNVPDPWKFVHYQGQTADELYEEILREES